MLNIPLNKFRLSKHCYNDLLLKKLPITVAMLLNFYSFFFLLSHHSLLSLVSFLFLLDGGMWGGYESLVVVGFDLVVVHNGFAIVVVMEVAATDVVRFYFFFFFFFLNVGVILAFWCAKVAFFLAHQILTF